MKKTVSPKRTKLGDGSTAKHSEQRYWLVKSEPNVFSIDDLAKAKKQTTFWDGVRNYQARNTLRDDMRVGDLVLFYHSNANPPAVAGIARVVREGYVDHTAFDPQDEHYDPKSKKSEPTWYMVDIQFVEKFAQVVSLPTLKQIQELQGMVLLQNSRLSVQPVKESEYLLVTELGRRKDR